MSLKKVLTLSAAVGFFLIGLMDLMSKNFVSSYPYFMMMIVCFLLLNYWKKTETVESEPTKKQNKKKKRK